MRHIALAAVAAACAAAIAIPAQASYVINIGQSGSDVVASGSGSIDFVDLSFVQFDSAPSLVDASGDGLFLNGSAGYGDIYDGASGPASFGSGGNIAASFTTGGNLASIGVMGANEIIIPGGYFPGSPMDPVTATWSNQTVASLGLTPGAYVWSWGSGAHADSLTINISGSIPEPSTWALMLAGVFGLGAALRAHRRMAPAH